MNRGEAWLAIQLPHLALDLLTRAQPVRRALPVAISDGDARKPRVLDCNPAAARHGIRRGLAVSAALGLAEGLYVAGHDATALRAALQRLAAWCYQFSSQVSILADRDALLLEVGASHRLFGEPGELAQRLSGHLARLGYHARTGIAPTPEAALVAARHGLVIRQRADIPAQLGSLPLDSLALDTGRQAALGSMGFRTIAEVLRLPRKALARRQGPAVVDYLDRLLGTRPDPRRAWHPAEAFDAGLELPAEIAHSQGLLFPLRRLLEELCGMLRAMDRGVQEVNVELSLRKGREAFRLGLQSPGRDPAHLMALLRERLERLRLSQPVRHVRVRADAFLPCETRQATLLEAGSGAAGGAVEPLLERLAARLGRNAVHGLRGVQDHRPEYSWALRPPGAPADCEPLPHRPVWLYEAPQPCRIEDYQLLAGPERIETGWWDGRDCRRDYYVVRDAHGSTLWAYREYKPHPGWYLHGAFG